MNALKHDFVEVKNSGWRMKCRFCHCYKYQDAADELCLMADTCLAEEASDKERDERSEYEFMKKQRERWDYLSRKYGGFKGE